MVTEFELMERKDMFHGSLLEAIKMREAFYSATIQCDDSPLLRTPMSVEQINEYQRGTQLLLSVLNEFKRVFEV